MCSSTVLLKVVAVGPGVVVSAAVGWALAALLPSPASFLAVVAAATVVVALSTGRLERPAVRLLADARRLTEAEDAVFAPVLTRLSALGIGPPAIAVHVRRSAGPHPPAEPMGRASVVLSRTLVEAVYRGRVDVEEAAALVTHAVGRLRHGNTRFDLALLVATIPWRLLSGACHRVGAAVAWVPFLRLAWQLRAGVAAVAVVQSAADGRLASAVIIVVFIAATYAVPRSRQAWARQMERAADEFVAAHGLGEPMTRLLQRQGGQVPALERVHRLQETHQHPS